VYVSSAAYAALKELVRRYKVRQALESEFEAVPGDRRFCLRRLEVVEHVSRVLAIPVINNDVFADVEQAARALGWEAVKNGGRSLFRCVKRRDLEVDEALAVSRANRQDPRSRRTATPELDDADSITG